MAYVADLHIHSRFSRACSQQLNVPNLASWAKLKGIDLLGTGDFLHPLWLAELKSQLKDDGTGFLIYEKDPSVKFILTCEVASIYSHKGAVRRIHNVIVMPSFESAEALQKALLSKRANLSSDGRPIVGISSKDLLRMCLEIDEQVLFIPAHCVLPSTLIHTAEGMREIQNIQAGEFVYTHKSRKRKVSEVLKHQHKGELYKIQPWYFSLGLEATSEHPFYGFKVKNCPSNGDRCIPTRAHKSICKHRFFERYKPQWLSAKDLKVGDMVAFPRFRNTTPMPILPIDKVLSYTSKGGLVHTGGSRGYIFKNNVNINEDFCHLIGYYLAEGWVSTTKGAIGFAFSGNELNYINEVKESIKNVFGITHSYLYKRVDSDGLELIISSKLVSELFAKLFYSDSPFKANNKTLPDWMLHLPEKLQAQILRGWWRGDQGYTVSRQLMNQMKIICIRLGIIPSIGIDSAKNHFKRGNHNYEGRVIKASTDLFYFSNLAFFEDNYDLLSDPSFKECRRKLDRRHGWIDENYIYLPIRKISTREYQGEVFNLEVEEDNSYVTEFATVHNCWTPWFGIFGSMSGYDLLSDCFEDLSEYIYAIETGLSSDPAMNWRIKELDNRSVISCSDAHSLPNLGRESTVFAGKIEAGYAGLFNDIKTQKIAGTIEFYPEEGKYHYTGHRNCNIKYSPQDSKTNGINCPSCKRDLTVGVMERVEELASRSEQDLKIQNTDGLIKSMLFPSRAGYKMLVPLLQIIAEAYHTAPTTQKVLNEYKKLTSFLGSEIKILSRVPIEDIARIANAKIAEGISKVRKGDLVIDPGYDGVYGVVKIWGQEAKEKEEPQLVLFE